MTLQFDERLKCFKFCCIENTRLSIRYFAGYSEGYSSAGSYLHEQLSAKENKVIQLNGEVAELRRKVFDLEEALSEKEQVLGGKNQLPCIY